MQGFARSAGFVNCGRAVVHVPHDAPSPHTTKVLSSTFVPRLTPLFWNSRHTKNFPIREENVT